MTNHILDKDLQGLPVNSNPQLSTITAKQESRVVDYSGPVPPASGRYDKGKWQVVLGTAFACEVCGIACESAEEADKCCKVPEITTEEGMLNKTMMMRRAGARAIEVAKELGINLMAVHPIVMAADTLLMEQLHYTRRAFDHWRHAQRRQIMRR